MAKWIDVPQLNMNQEGQGQGQGQALGILLKILQQENQKGKDNKGTVGTGLLPKIFGQGGSEGSGTGGLGGILSTILKLFL